MYFVDLMKIVLRDDPDLSKISNDDLNTILSDDIFETQPKGSDLLYICYNMKKIVFVIPSTTDGATSFKNSCATFVARMANLSHFDYDETDIALFSDYLYYNTLYYELINYFPNDVFLNDMNDLEEQISNYEYTTHDGCWVAQETLKSLLLRLYNCNTKFINDYTKVFNLIEELDGVTPIRLAAQAEMVDNVQLIV